MSIIHEALKRRDEETGVDVPGDEVFEEDGTGAPTWLPAALGAGGVILAAVLTYTLTRPSEITVIVPPPGLAAVAPAPAAPGALDAVSTSIDAPMAEGFLPPVLVPSEPVPQNGIVTGPGNVYVPQATPRQTAPQGSIPATNLASPGSPATGAMPMPGSDAPFSPAGDPAGMMSVPPGLEPPADYRDIPVYNGAQLANPPDLPEDAMTIEMAEGRLVNAGGAVNVNGAPAPPGASLRVGSEIRTDPGGGASLAFDRAQIELSSASTARITRLERQSSGTGRANEQVSLYLRNGSARTSVRPGEGSVLLSTEQVTATSQSGSFTVTANPDGSVVVKNEGGTVRVAPNGQPDATVTLENGQSVTYRNGTRVP